MHPGCYEAVYGSAHDSFNPDGFDPDDSVPLNSDDSKIDCSDRVESNSDDSVSDNPDSEESESDDPEPEGDPKPTFDLRPRVPFADVDSLYLQDYRDPRDFQYDASEPRCYLPANLTRRTFYRVALDINMIKERVLQFIKCFVWTSQFHELVIVAFRRSYLHPDCARLRLVELDEGEEHPEANEKKDLLQRLLSEWEYPSANEVELAFGGSIQILAKENFRLPKVKVMGITERNFRI